MDSATPTIFSGLFGLILVGGLIYFFEVSVRILKEGAVSSSDSAGASVYEGLVSFC
jgi:hypothetical protein